MMPHLFSWGPIVFSSFGLFFALSFLVLIFFVWRTVKEAGIEEEKIFDNTIVVALLTLLGARIAYILLHWSIFAQNWLRMFVVWRFPGLSFWGGLLFAVLTLYYYTRRQKLSQAIFFEGYARAFPVVMFLMSIGIFLDGTLVGKVTQWKSGLPVTNHPGLRHPVGLYAAALALLGMVLLAVVGKYAPKKLVQKGLISWVVLSFIGVTQLLLAFFRDDVLYWQSFSPDYFIATILAIMPLVPIFKLLDGQAKIKLLLAKLRERRTGKV